MDKANDYFVAKFKMPVKDERLANRTFDHFDYLLLTNQFFTYKSCNQCTYLEHKSILMTIQRWCLQKMFVADDFSATMT